MDAGNEALNGLLSVIALGSFTFFVAKLEVIEVLVSDSPSTSTIPSSFPTFSIFLISLV